MNNTIRALLWCAIASCAWAGIFIKDQQYRYCSGDECKGFCGSKQPACNKPAGAGLPLTLRTPEYSMSFIEYHENGRAWDGAQYEVAKALIDGERKRSAGSGETLGPATVFLYIHGWKNNANDRGDDADVARFQRYLEMYSEYVQGQPRPVVGIYLAWRGRSLELPGWITWLTFWTRSAAARRVGNGDINDHIDKLVGAAIEHRERMAVERRPYAIVIGHSFGARVLETALIGKSKTTVTGSCRTLALTQEPLKPPADLVLFENAATSAGYIRRQVYDCQPCGNKREGCKDHQDKPNFTKSVMTRNPTFERSHCAQHPLDRRCQPYPLMMAVSSSQDWLTRGLLFIAAFQHPAAFFPWRQTHHISPAAEADTVDPRKGQVFLFQTPPERRDDPKPKATYMVARKNTRTISPVNPVWVIEVGKSISSSHGDVWNATMMNMVVNLLAADGNMHGPGPAPAAAARAEPLKSGVVPQRAVVAK